MRCDCGKRIYLGKIPCPYQWNFISDNDFDNYQGMINSSEIYQEMESFVKCPSCGSLWFFWDGWNSKAQKYTPCEIHTKETNGEDQ